jgi:hypothetical protein
VSRRFAAFVAVLACAGMTLPATARSTHSAPRPGTPAYIARDDANIAHAFGRQLGPGGQARSLRYGLALFPDLVTTELDQLKTQLATPNALAVTGGGLVPGWNDGNPYRRTWAGHRGRISDVAFRAADGALLRGRIFAPLAHGRDPYTHRRLHGPYPGVVIVTGSVQGSQGVYAWLAEDLAERGYLVMTFDVQGQGMSQTTGGPADPLRGVPSERAANFVNDTEDAVSFFLSTPMHRYRGAFNPRWTAFDRSPDRATVTPGRTTRLAIIGHSTGAVTVSYLQGVDRRVETAVALDKLTATPSSESDVGAAIGSLPGPVRPVVPALALQSEYGFEPQPYWLAGCSSFDPCPGSPAAAPDPRREESMGFDIWRRHHVDSMIVVPRASTHLDYTDVPFVLPASRDGQAMASYYVQAWLDKYLEHKPSADSRLLSRRVRYLEPVGRGVWAPMSIARNAHLSFYFCSGYAFHRSNGRRVVDRDLTHLGC